MNILKSNILTSINEIKDFYNFINNKKFKNFVLEKYKNQQDWYRNNNYDEWKPSETDLGFHELNTGQIDVYIDFNFESYQGCNEYLNKSIELDIEQVFELIEEYGEQND